MKMVGIRMLLMTMLMTILMSGIAFAEDELKQENADLRKRVEDLERSLGEIKDKLAEQPKTAAQGEKHSILSKYPVELYGFIKADAAYMTQRANDVGNYARWVESEEFNPNDDQFNMTARESRFGLNFSGPDIVTMKTSGRVEVDFYEGGAENKNRPMMRQAYLDLDWPRIDLSVLAGQTNDVISPLAPDTLNYSVGWWIGNIGYRRPQFRLSKGFDLGGGYSLLIQVAAARTIGDAGPFSPQDTGKDAGFPSIQALYSISFPLLTNRKTSIGISGHWGEEEYDYDIQGNNVRLKTWSVTVDLLLPICDWMSFKGEFWTGENLDAYLGGVGQGIIIQTSNGQFMNGEGVTGTFIRAWTIGSTGGWVAITFGPWYRCIFNTGISIDDPDDDDISHLVPLDDGRTWNSSYWGNVVYDINNAVRVGFELSYWETKYKYLAHGDAIRVQTSLIYRF